MYVHFQAQRARQPSVILTWFWLYIQCTQSIRGLFNKTPAEREEKVLHQEAKHDDKAVKAAIKDVGHAEKTEHKTAKEHAAAVKAHAKAVETEHKLAAKLNELQHEHDAALSRETKLAKDIQIKEQRHAEAEQAIAAKKMALEQNQRKHDVHDATRTEKLQQLHATSTTGERSPVVGEPGYNNAATGVQGAPVAGGPGYEAGAPARY